MATRMSSEQRREQIAEAVLKLAGNGLKNVTIEKVAVEIGVVPSAIYRHYRNKTDMLSDAVAVLRPNIKKNFELAKEHSQNPMERLHFFLLAHVRMLQDKPGIGHILFSDAIPDNSKKRLNLMRENIRITLEGLVELVADGQSKGMIRTDISAERIAAMFPGMFAAENFKRKLFGMNDDYQEQIESNWKIFSDGIAVR